MRKGAFIEVMQLNLKFVLLYL